MPLTHLTDSEDDASSESLATADDETLARALIAGDKRAPRVAWARFAPMVYRILRRTFGPGVDIEDIHQDIFLAFFRKVGALREPKSVKAFLVSITARTIKYQLRLKRARRFMLFWNSTENLDDPAVEPPDDSAQQTLVAFYAVLDKLNARDRTAFGLRFLEGMELAQVASTLGISVSTTKRHLARIWKLVAVRVRNDPALAAHRMSSTPPPVFNLAAMRTLATAAPTTEEQTASAPDADV
jgi:RNA polymerase sigma-70 factor (ECF subfamily)